MAVRAGNVDRQRRTSLVGQQVDLTALLAVIRWVAACLLAAQGGWTAFAVKRLPFPLDLAFLGVELDHDLHDPLENTVLWPGLKAFVQHTAGDTKPILVHRFPLTPRPQHIPNAI